MIFEEVHNTSCCLAVFEREVLCLKKNLEYKFGNFFTLYERTQSGKSWQRDCRKKNLKELLLTSFHASVDIKPANHVEPPHAIPFQRFMKFN